MTWGNQWDNSQCDRSQDWTPTHGDVHLTSLSYEEPQASSWVMRNLWPNDLSSLSKRPTTPTLRLVWTRSSYFKLLSDDAPQTHEQSHERLAQPLKNRGIGSTRRTHWYTISRRWSRIKGCVCLCVCMCRGGFCWNASRFTQINKWHKEAETKDRTKIKRPARFREKSQHCHVLTNCELTIQWNSLYNLNVWK